MPALNWNNKKWNEDYLLKDPYEQWSSAWGGSVSQWFGSLLPRIHGFIPCNNTLEIACGFGRWTKFLLPLTINQYIGIDKNENCILSCKKQFESDNASFFQNDGYSLELAKSIKFDFIFSFDSMVHEDVSVLNAYIQQIMELLSDNGICFIHHSNFGQIITPNISIIDHPGFIHNRDQSSSAAIVKNIVNQYGGKIIIQELINWGCDSLIDCITLFSRKDSNYHSLNEVINNVDFMNEAENCKNIFQFYNI
jgi:SAM-dependent methyltransferase